MIMQLTGFFALVIFLRPTIIQPGLDTRTQMDSLVEINLAVEQIANDHQHHNSNNPVHTFLWSAGCTISPPPGLDVWRRGVFKIEQT